MNEEQIIALATKIRDGKATEEEKNSYLKFCKDNLTEVSNLLKEIKARANK